MTHISATIPLTLGIIAGSLFILVLVGSLLITMRNRRIIRRHSDYAVEEEGK